MHSQAICNIIDSLFILPRETDERSCVFEPDRDTMEALRPSFEPKLKAVRLSHVDDEPVARVDSSADTNAHEKTDFSGCSSVQT